MTRYIESKIEFLEDSGEFDNADEYRKLWYIIRDNYLPNVISQEDFNFIKKVQEDMETELREKNLIILNRIKENNSKELK